MAEELKLHEDDDWYENDPEFNKWDDDIYDDLDRWDEIEEDDGLEWTLKDEIRYYIWKHPFAFCSFCLMTGAIIYKMASFIYKKGVKHGRAK